MTKKDAVRMPYDAKVEKTEAEFMGHCEEAWTRVVRGLRRRKHGFDVILGKLENMNEKMSARSEHLVERLTCITGV